MFTLFNISQKHTTKRNINELLFIEFDGVILYDRPPEDHKRSVENTGCRVIHFRTRSMIGSFYRPLRIQQNE